MFVEFWVAYPLFWLATSGHYYKRAKIAHVTMPLDWPHESFIGGPKNMADQLEHL